MSVKEIPPPLGIDGERLFSHIMELGKIGRSEGGGVSRTALSHADMEARAWLMERMERLGLEVRVDAALNIIGRLRSSRKRDNRVLVIGSHLDTVPQGGMFDGAVGVLAGLECARFLLENAVELPWDLEVIDFTDEEAAHNAGTVGSRAMMGLLQEGEIFVSKAKGLSSLAEDLERLGKDPRMVNAAIRPPSAFRAMIELHIEQGAFLESKGIPIGIVTGIVGIYRYVVKVLGKASHAGTTPMHLRDDALVKASPVFWLLPQWVRAKSREMVGTIGQVSLEPGATNVVPGECRFVVELRSMEPRDMIDVREVLAEWVATHPGSSMETIYEKDSVLLSEAMVDLIARAADIEGLPSLRMASGAGHDAQSFAPFVPTGMIFIPCRGGMSHCPEEWADPQAVYDGCRVLVRTVLELAWQDLRGFEGEDR